MTTTTTMPEAKVTYVTTPRDLHILMPWLNVVRRLRDAALGGGSRSAIKIIVIANCDGEPVQWTAPKVTAIEPRANGQALDDLLNTLGE